MNELGLCFLARIVKCSVKEYVFLDVSFKLRLTMHAKRNHNRCSTIKKYYF